jgi:hypothetical protein
MVPLLHVTYKLCLCFNKLLVVFRNIFAKNCEYFRKEFCENENIQCSQTFLKNIYTSKELTEAATRTNKNAKCIL